MNALLLWALLLAPAAAFGADREFDRLVKAVETRFGVERTRIPMMGAANFFVKVARPSGARGIKLAIFEDMRLPLDEEGGELDRMMAEASAGLRPVAVVRSRGERTYIYAIEISKTAKMLVAAFERDEATIVQVKLGIDDLMRALAEPWRAGRILGGDRGHREDRDREGR